MSAPRLGAPLVVALLSVSACSPPKAAMVAELPAAVDVGQSATRYALDGDNATLEAEVSAGPTFTITFSELSGELVMLGDDPTKSTLTLSVSMRRASSTPEVVADIAMGPDFLDAATYPTAEFASRQITRAGGDGFEVLGELTLHGITRGLRTPATIEVTKCEIAAEIAFSFDRHAFGIETEGSLEDIVSDTVAVRITAAIDRCPPSKR